MNKVKCPKCGHMNHPNEDHCSNCGYSLKQTKEASTISFLQSMYKTAMACPRAAGDVDLNTKNRDKTIERHNYGPLNLNDKGYWEFVADKWNTTPDVAKKSKCGNCVAFDVSPRMDDCMPGPVSDRDGRLGYCWMHHFKCHSARTCTTWAKGGPIKKDEVSHDWQKKAKGMEKEAFFFNKKQPDPTVGAVKNMGGVNVVYGSPYDVVSEDLGKIHENAILDALEKGHRDPDAHAMKQVRKHPMFSALEKEHGIKYTGMRLGPSGPGTYRLTDAAGGFGKQAEDSSVKSDILKAFKAEGGALGMKALKKHVKAPDVQARLKDLMEEGRVYKHRHGDFIEKEARMLPGQFSGVTKAYDGLARISANVAKRTPVKPLPLNSKATPTAASSLKTRLDDIYAQYQKNQAALNSKYTTKLAAEGEYDDSHMLSKILMRMSAQSAHLKEKIDAGLVIPSWAEYKLYNAYSSLGSALGTAYPGEYEKEATATATKTDPAKWEAAKREAKAKMGGKHSARAMQLATQIYKKKGGGYSGAKPSSSNNSLKKWTNQDWGYSGKDKPGQGGSGVYLPKRRRAALKATKKGRSMLASATRKKHKATSRGQQYSSHGLAAGTSLKKTAESPERSDVYAGLGAGGLGAGAILSNKPQKLIHKGGVYLVKNTGGAAVTPEEMQELSKKHGIQIQAGDKSSLREFTDGSTRITLGGETGNRATLAHELGHAKDKKKGGLIDKSKLKKGSLSHTLATLRNEGVANIYAVQDRGLKQIPNAMGSYATYLAGAAGRHRKGLAAMSVAPLGIGGYAASKSLRDREKTASSSRVKSPHAFYQPTQVAAPPPQMNPGNTETVNQQAQSHAMAIKNREQQYQGMAPQPAPPSIQQNSPAVPQPFKPKYTGMP